ncbi:class I SAM-dependent methyltransferase [soil metagenome]
MDKKKVDDFWSKRAKIADPRVATHFKKDDTHVFDLELIRNYTQPDSDILDMGCGTCYLANELADEVNYIRAVDKYPEFLEHCHIGPNLEICTSDVIDYTDNRQYDIILLFGVVMYFSEEDTKKIYAMCHKLLRDNGTLIVKHQCGVDEDVAIDNYSSAIGDNYYAVYKHVDTDKKLLEEFYNVEVVDVYPPRLNPWPNTHFYGFIGKKK